MTDLNWATRHWRLTLAAAALASIAVLGGCGTPSPTGPEDTYGLDFAMQSNATQSGAIIFLVDGLNAEIFDEMLTAGELPAIQKYFVDRGLYVRRAVANVPSVTLANLTSIVTGRFCGHHRLVGINWFDRNRLIWRNYETIAQKNTLDGDYVAPNLYEQFPDRTTFSVFYQPHRGATKFIENWTSAGPPFYFGWYEFVDRLTLFRLNIVADVARKRNEWPAVTMIYLLAPDFRAYDDGFDSPEYRDAIRHADYQIGRVCGDLARAGLLEKLHLAIVSDHGHREVKQHFPIKQFLADELHLPVARKRLWEITSFEKRQDYYRTQSAVICGSGDRYVSLHLRKRGKGKGPTELAAWPQRPTPEDLANYPVGGADLLARLVEQPAVDVVAWSAGPNRVRLRRKTGEVEFHQAAGPGGDITYSRISGDDPLGWGGHVDERLLTGQPATPRQWLDATIATEYPDTPAQILAYFRSDLAGDIALFAAPGWDFNNNNRAGHGGLGPADMLVPMLLAGPGVEHGRLDTARTVDLMPTLLHLQGRPIPPGLDGESLLGGPAGE